MDGIEFYHTAPTLLAGSRGASRGGTDDITVDPNSIGATNVGGKVDEAKKEVAETANDKWILGKIESKLVVAGISGATVDVQNGEVVLKGAVKTQAEKTEAEDLARNTDGVTKVSNQLNVKKA